MELIGYLIFLTAVMWAIHPRHPVKKDLGIKDNKNRPRVTPVVTAFDDLIVTTPPLHSVAEWVKPTNNKDYINYSDYIQSPEWQRSIRRLDCIKAANNKCQMCGVGFSLEVHHISYTNLGKELPQELVLLCTLCHEHTHKMAGKGARYYPPIKRPMT